MAIRPNIAPRMKKLSSCQSIVNTHPWNLYRHLCKKQSSVELSYLATFSERPPRLKTKSHLLLSLPVVVKFYLDVTLVIKLKSENNGGGQDLGGEITKFIVFLNYVVRLFSGYLPPTMPLSVIKILLYK